MQKRKRKFSKKNNTYKKKLRKSFEWQFHNKENFILKYRKLKYFKFTFYFKCDI